MLNIIYLEQDFTMIGSNSILAILVMSLVVGLVIAVWLLAQSRTKIKASKAEKYISSSLKLTQSSDVYTHTTTTKRKVD